MIQANHLNSDFFDTADGVLLINGQPVDALAREYGTPFYAYDKSVIERRYKLLRDALPSRIDIHFAMKANPMPEVVHQLAELVDGIDIASGGELRIATQTSCPREEMSFAGPGKSLAEIELAVQSGIVLNAESKLEIERISSVADALDVRAAVAVRVNPDFELKNSGMRMSGGPKQFGIDAEQVPEVLQSWPKQLNFEGFHIFTGSQNLNAESIVAAQQNSYALAMELAAHAPNDPRFLNLGGGFGIPYFPGDADLDLAPIAQCLATLDEDLQARFPECHIVIELGRYLVGECGVYVCEVVDLKESRGVNFAVTNGGLHHHLAASGNFGQILRKNYPVLVANKADLPAEQTATVVGPLCTPLDLLGDKVNVPELQVGDLIAVMQSGAYGYTASPHLFLSHGAPQEIFCGD